MAPISLKIVLDEGAVTRKVKFDTRQSVAEAHEIVKEKVTVSGPGKEYGLFLRSADGDMTGIWLENDRNLEYYMLRDGDSLDYVNKFRNLRVKMLDDTLKTLQVDQSKTIGTLMRGICARIGILNYEEYGLCYDNEEELEEAKDMKAPTPVGTLTKRKLPQKPRDTELEELGKKIKTDDNVEWLDQHKTLRELAVEPSETLLLKRRLFYSDRNVDSRDPLQLNLLFLQTRDAILNGKHPVTEDQAADCKVRWVNIRDVHRRIWRKKLTEPKNTSRPYKYEKEMSFMKAFYKEVSSSMSLTDVEEDEKTYLDWDDQVVDTESQIQETEDSEDQIKKPIVKRRKSKKRQENNHSKEVYEEEEKPVSCSFVEATPTEFDSSDPVDAFLLSIGATLKTFNPYHLNLAKSKIFSVVQEHDLQQIMHKQSSDIKLSSSESLPIIFD